MLRQEQDELEKGAPVGLSNTSLIDAGPGDAAAVKNPWQVVQVRPLQTADAGEQSADLQSPGAGVTHAELHAQISALSLEEEVHEASGHVHAHGHDMDSSQSPAEQAAASHPDSQRQSQTYSQLLSDMSASASLGAAAAAAQDPVPAQEPRGASSSTTSSGGGAAAAPVSVQGGAPNLMARFQQQRAAPAVAPAPAPSANAPATTVPAPFPSQYQREPLPAPSTSGHVAASSSLPQRAAAARAALEALPPHASPADVAAAIEGLSKEEVLEAGLGDLVLAALGEISRPPAAGREPRTPSKSHTPSCAPGSSSQGARPGSAGKAAAGQSGGGASSSSRSTQYQVPGGGGDGSNSFDEEDPFQVLDESLVVLGEIEGLIRASIGLEHDTELGAVGEEEMGRVPAELIDALEETLSVIMDSRSEIDEITSSIASPASTRHHPGTGRTPTRPTSGSRGSAGSPYLASPARGPGHSKHIRPTGPTTHTFTASPGRPMSALSNARSTRPASGSAGGAGSYTPKRGSHAGSEEGGLGPQASSSTVGASSTYSRHTAMSYGAAPPPGGYLYQRMAAKKSEQEAEARKAALDAYRKRREGPTAPVAGWVSTTEQRAQEEARKRIQQVQADLQWISQLRDRQQAAMEKHAQTLEEAQANMEALTAHRTETAAANKWLDYQETLAARARLRRAAV